MMNVMRGRMIQLGRHVPTDYHTLDIAERIGARLLEADRRRSLSVQGSCKGLSFGDSIEAQIPCNGFRQHLIHSF